MATDRLGNEIFNGDYNVSYEVFDFPTHPQVYSSVSESDTSESVYVTYSNSENGNTITVRFSNHVNNAVEFGDQLDGNFASYDEVLCHLGLKKRTFIPRKKIHIRATQIKRALMQSYLEADLTMTEMYALGLGADISQYIGKRTKGGNWVIYGDKVEEIIETKQNRLGQSVQLGTYIYHD